MFSFADTPDYEFKPFKVKQAVTPILFEMYILYTG